VVNIEELSILEMSELLASGALTSLDLVQMYLERIAKYDKSGIMLNSVLEINPDALHIAEAMDYERKYKGKRSPLHGIPILLKDNINTGDMMHTSAGSLALAGHYAAQDAFLVRKLRAAGAVILGKANMTEFANYITEGMLGGYSSRGGQVKNPYDASKTPSGSSSGSAVAVAASLCAAAVGTETNGSIISPARANCVVGIKPTVGLVSRAGIIPIATAQDTAGPLARTVRDAALLLGAMTGVDDSDPATWKSAWGAYTDYTQFLAADVKGLRVGVGMAKYAEFTKDEQALLQEAADVLKAAGIEILEHNLSGNGLPPEGSSVLRHEFKAGLNYYLSTADNRTGLKTLADIMAFNIAEPENCLRYGQKRFEMAQATGGTLTEPEYLTDRLKDMQRTRNDGIDKIMDDLKLDALLYLENTSIAAVSGYPATIVPAGFGSDGTAYGITFIGKAFSEPTLLKLANVYEQKTNKRNPPVLR